MNSWIIEFASDADPGEIFATGKHLNPSVALLEAFAKLPRSFHLNLIDEAWSASLIRTGMEVGIRHLHSNADEGTYPITLIDDVLQLRISRSV